MKLGLWPSEWALCAALAIFVCNIILMVSR